MTALYLTLAAFILGYLTAHKRIERLTNERNNALVKWWQAEDKLYIAGLVNDTLVEDLRIAWGQPADDDIDQAIQLANSPRYESIVALIAANEAARFDADEADWGQR